MWGLKGHPESPEPDSEAMQVPSSPELLSSAESKTPELEVERQRRAAGETFFPEISLLFTTLK